MKADITDINTFKPFNITITIESAEEANKIHALFNTPPIVASYGLISIAPVIRDQICKRVAINDQVYTDCIAKLKKIIQFFND